MTGFLSAEWRRSRNSGRLMGAICTSALLLQLCGVVAAGADNGAPGDSVPQEFYDHPLIFLSISILLSLLVAILSLSRQKIQASERRYRALFQDNGAIMLLIDPISLRIMDANPAACAFYGWSPSDLLTMRIVDICSIPEAEVREIYEDVINNERRRFRARHRLVSGEERNVEINAMPYRVDERDCLFSIIHDVTSDSNESGENSWKPCSTLVNSGYSAVSSKKS